MKDYILGRIKNDKIQVIIFGIFLIFCICSSVGFGLTNQFRNMFMSILIILFIPAFYLVEYIFKIEFVTGFIVLMLLLIIGGTQLGPCYDFYSIFPIFDDILHGISGIIFGLFGFVISKRFIKDDRFSVHLFISVLFSFSIAFIWELIEYFGSSFFPLDMQEDMLVNDFKSYLLSGSHNDIAIIDNITETIIRYDDGKEIVIKGYLDLGLFDTLNDLLVCMFGTVAYIIALLLSNRFNKKINDLFIPKIR